MALVGINNENEFYSNHYLGEVFTSDIRDVLEPWIEQENAARGAERAAREQGKEVEAGYRAPWNQLNSLATEYFRKLTDHEKQRQIPQRLADQRTRWQPLLKALGYELNPHIQMLDDDTPLPVLARYNSTDGSPWLWIVEAHDQEEGTLDPLALSLLTAQFPADTDKHKRDSLRKKANGEYRSWQDLLSTVVFTQNEPPRFVLLLGNRQLLLLDRTKWAQNRLLRFDFEEILSRRETDTLKATSVLLHKDSLLPGSGAPYLDSLDDNSHKHAFGVSEDLKYALRESIELLGNEAMRYLINNELAYYTGKRAINPDELSRECLRYMYRLLFLFYIEARPELGYAPMTAKTYLQGYSLETLRDLEMIPLTSEEDRNGRYFHDSLNMLFKLVRDGYSGGVKMQSDLESGDRITIHSHQFSVPRLESHLFDANNTRILNRVVFRNETLQQIIQAMSLSRPGKGRFNRRGRISYRQLGINQLGAVYEALLSYRGFFASDDLYEVKKAGEEFNELETGYFVSKDEIGKYHDDEKVYEKDGSLRIHRKGSFIYRMAGRDREKSASYYTPEVLTRSLVKYALKELFKEQIDPITDPHAKADAILNLTVCEPAMGSAAFLNEAINQLAEAYLFHKQQAEGRRIPQDRYTQELQRVKMYIADNNVFGVDLNPVAVELAEVSLWLNAISGDAFVPWFGYQLHCGNSLVGARRQVFNKSELTYKKAKDPSWLNSEPAELTMNIPREDKQIFHFLLPDTPDEEQFNADFLDESSVGFVRTGELVNYLKASCQSLSIDKLPIEEYRSLVYRLNNVRQLEQRSTSTGAEGQKVTRARYTNVSENLSYDFSAETTMNWLHASAQAIGALLQLELEKQLASLSIPAELLKAHFLAETKAGNALLELVKRSLASDYASLFNQLSGHSGDAFALDNLLSRLVNAYERIERDLFDKNTLWVHPSEEEWLIVKEAKAAVTTLREMSVVLVVVERVRDENDRIRRKATEILIETYTDLLNIFAQNGSVRSEDGLSVYVAEDAEIIWECRTDLKLVCDIPPVVNSIKITWAKDFDAVNIHLINQKLFGINKKRIFSLSESNPFVRKIEVGEEKTQTSLAARLRSQMQRIYSSWQYADLYRDALLSFPQYWQDYSHVSQASERLKAKLLADHDKDILLALAQIITRGAQSSRLAPRLQEQPCYPSVFIDEVQDFTEVQVFLMAQQADPKYHAVTLVGDMHQQLGRGNVRDLDACFPYHSLTKFLLKENKRQEREPQLAATSMLFRALVQNDSRLQESAGQLTLWREQAQNGTNKKFINQPFDNIDAELVDLISEQPHGRTIAVICPDLALARELEERVRNDLIQKSSRTPRVAEHIDLAQKYQVHFSCAENVKGLEFDTMIYVGLEKIDWANPQELNKVYVTISRPRKRLIMFGNQYDLPDTVATCLLTYSECRSA